MKRSLSFLLLLTIAVLLAAEPVRENVAVEMTMDFADDSGRTVTIPANVERVAPSGAVATMFLAAFAPEKMVTVSGRIGAEQEKYLPEVLATLPETGQMYGSKASLNLEELLKAGPELIIDMGDYKKTIGEDLDALVEQTGIPAIFIEADIAHMAQAFRTLGKILKMEERGEELALFVEETLSIAEKAKSAGGDVPSVMYTSGPSGLAMNAKGSTQAQVLDIVGVENAIVVENVSNKGGGNVVSLESVLKAAPDVIIFTSDSIASTVRNEDGWKELDAVREGRYAVIPSLPYNWMGNPPSMNMLLGVWWLGSLVSPEAYGQDITGKAMEIFSLLWGKEIGRSEMEELLEHSSYNTF